MSLGKDLSGELTQAVNQNWLSKHSGRGDNEVCPALDIHLVLCLLGEWFQAYLYEIYFLPQKSDLLHKYIDQDISVQSSD